MVRGHLGDPAGPAARSCPSKVPEHPACRRRCGLLSGDRSTPRAHPSRPESPFHPASLWLPEVPSVLAARHAPEAQRHWHQGVPWARWLLLPPEIPWSPSLQQGQAVLEAPETPARRADPGLQVPPRAPGLPLPEAQALPAGPSVLAALELPVSRAGPVSQAGPRPPGPALLWGRASQAVPPSESAAPAGWGRRCSHRPFLLWAPWGPEPLALPTVPAAPRCLAFQDLQDSLRHPSAPSIRALQPCPVSLAGRSPEAPALPFLQEGPARPPRGRPRSEAWTELNMARKAPPSPL